MWPAAADSEEFGHYRLLRPLGRGGMGEVYLARDLVLGRNVAIKFLTSDKPEGSDARRRLLREARAAAALDHPGICSIFETGEAPDGRAFIVMQYVEGETLSTKLAHGSLPIDESVALGLQIAEALAAAHRHHVIHRDLKPSNVIVTGDGKAKLLDFGIAKVLLAPAALADAPTTSEGTVPGLIVGTPAYMAPEQVQQGEIDGRTDLFALGVLLYECFTGRRAFDAATPLETLANVLHREPPAPSSLRQGLTDRHDALCRRLMAKDPADRYQSAMEAIGALRVLSADTSGQTGPPDPLPGPPPQAGGGRTRRLALAIAAACLAAGAAAGWLWLRPQGLPPVPPDADVWYQRGNEAIDEGTYYKARLSFQEAVRRFPAHVLAHARLAEANAELDDQAAAQQELLRVSLLVPNESRLPDLERTRLRAVRTFVLREVDRTVAIYRELAARNPQDARAWLALGRAQEAAGLRGDARASYSQALAVDPQNAAAWLRLGSVESLEARRDEAVAAFREAERLYRLASNVEGETQVLLRRGMMFDAFGAFAEARADVERAIALARTSDVRHQQIQARLVLSSITATGGRFAEAERIAAAAVEDARAANLDTIAADGLIDLAATLLQSERLSDAEAQVQRAIVLAERRGARRTEARARLQLAAVYEAANRSGDAIKTVSRVLPFLRANAYRRYELLGQSIAARAHERLDELDRARQVSRDVLAAAETIKDEGQIALATSSLASVSTALGEYPAALVLRERAEAIHRRQGDQASLPFDLTNRADLLIRLGRAEDAGPVFSELEAGMAAGREAYVGRRRWAAFLRARAAAQALRCGEALRIASTIPTDSGPADLPSVLTPPVRDFCDAMLGRRARAQPAPLPPAVPTLARERQYWLAAAALVRGDAGAADAHAANGLALLGDLPNDEIRWRLAAVGSAAAERLRQPGRAVERTALARDALRRLQVAWKDAFEVYGKRADVVDLRKRARLE
jgi:tetratricopeptide (TPR) repeat protein